MIQVLEQEKAARQGLESSLQALAAITPEELVRTEQLGTALDFSQGTEVFARTLGLFRSLQESNLDNVPHNILTQLTQFANEAASTFKQIQSFDPSGQNNPASVRDNLIQQVANQYQSSFPHIAPVIAYSVRRGTDFERLERDARGTVEELNRMKRESDTKASALVSDAQATLEQVRRAAAEVGVAQHAVHFKQEATDHLDRSKKWLWATGVAAVTTLAFALWTVYFYATKAIELSTTQSVQLAVSKVIVFSLLYFGIVWSARMYRSQWHNYVVNKHRQNALSTFETFVKAASDDQTKNAVLIQATHCIFSPQVTGFVAHDTEAASSPQILEIVRGVVTQKGTTQA
ncbi:MAG TPA: hypothetical protein VNM15_06080 [Candidatus Binatia bacterium]|nr:hypothetical protein [Candidatus Binatia bacterium]